ncbi:MAG: OmpA family protein [bacterium]|nr:OmpA family protein [bacterium]MDT8366804.1 OmpA family protein [bacterium]
MLSRSAKYSLPILLSALVILTFSVGRSLADGPDYELILTVGVAWDAAGTTEREKAFLDRIKQLIKKDPTLTVAVIGHTDTLGSENENMAIGFYYASRIADQLADTLQFPYERIEIISRGESEPVVTPGSFDKQVENRRVVIRLATTTSIKVAKQPPAKTQGKKILILEPVSGTVDRAYQRVRAIVEGGSQTALLTINGISSLITVQNSRIDTEIVLERGNNTLEVIAWDDSGSFGRDSVEVNYISPPPEIKIHKPLDGDLFDTIHSLVVEVSGKIKAQTQLAETFLFLNGAPRRIEVDEQGNFSQPVVLIRKTNRIKIEALDIYGKTDTSEDITVSTINLAPKDIVVYLTWDQPGVDMDLHILGPDGEHTYYAALDPVESSEAIPQGALDLDDKNGFGPEVFSMSGDTHGQYTIEARYHHSQDNVPSQAQVTVVLYPAEPARRITRIFGPKELNSDKDRNWIVTEIDLPEGIFSGLQ